MSVYKQNYNRLQYMRVHSFAILEPDYNECFWQAACGLLSVLLPGLYNCDPGVAMPLGAHRLISSYTSDTQSFCSLIVAIALA